MKRDEKLTKWRQNWLASAHKRQTPPPGDWDEWGIVAGRGFGATWAALHWLSNEALTCTEGLSYRVVAPTVEELRFVVFEGDSGLLRTIPKEMVRSYNRATNILTLDNGATISGFSAGNPDQFSLPPGGSTVCENLEHWGRKGDRVWQEVRLMCRMGSSPKVVWTAHAPLPDWVKELMAPTDKRVLTKGVSIDNKQNLPRRFFDALSQVGASGIS